MDPGFRRDDERGRVGSGNRGTTAGVYTLLPKTENRPYSNTRTLSPPIPFT
jgi:hypothetical protein